MKSFNIIGIHQFLGEEGHKKNSIYWKFPKHGRLDNLQEDLVKNRENYVFEER